MYKRVAYLYTFTVLFFLALGSFVSFRIYFATDKTLPATIARLQHQLAGVERDNRVLEARYLDLHQSAAAYLPDLPEFKNLNSTLRKPAASLVLNTPEFLFDQARTYFRLKKYDEAKVVFESLIEEFPNSSQTIPAYFFLGESQFLLKDQADCLKTIEAMVELFPQHELTGHLLFRLVDIMVQRGKDRQATQIIQVLKTQFPASKEIKSRAQYEEERLSEVL